MASLAAAGEVTAIEEKHLAAPVRGLVVNLFGHDSAVRVLVPIAAQWLLVAHLVTQAYPARRAVTRGAPAIPALLLPARGARADDERATARAAPRGHLGHFSRPLIPRACASLGAQASCSVDGAVIVEVLQTRSRDLGDHKRP